MVSIYQLYIFRSNFFNYTTLKYFFKYLLYIYINLKVLYTYLIKLKCVYNNIRVFQELQNQTSFIFLIFIYILLLMMNHFKIHIL